MYTTTSSSHRYNSVGQLTCAVCSVPVKSGIVWPAHLQSKRHKEVAHTPHACFNVHTPFVHAHTCPPYLHARQV